MVSSILGASTSGVVTGFNAIYLPLDMMLKTATNEAAGKLRHRGVLFSYVEVTARPGTKLEGVFSIMLAVTLAHNYIVCAKEGHDVGDHITSRHMVKRSHMNEGRRADLQAVRFALASADDVEP